MYRRPSCCCCSGGSWPIASSSSAPARTFAPEPLLGEPLLAEPLWPELLPETDLGSYKPTPPLSCETQISKFLPWFRHPRLEHYSCSAQCMHCIKWAEHMIPACRPPEQQSARTKNVGCAICPWGMRHIGSFVCRQCALAAQRLRSVRVSRCSKQSASCWFTRLCSMGNRQAGDDVEQ